jgi:hypothetical protein
MQWVSEESCHEQLLENSAAIHCNFYQFYSVHVAHKLKTAFVRVTRERQSAPFVVVRGGHCRSGMLKHGKDSGEDHE